MFHGGAKYSMEAVKCSTEPLNIPWTVSNIPRNVSRPRRTSSPMLNEKGQLSIERGNVLDARLTSSPLLTERAKTSTESGNVQGKGVMCWTQDLLPHHKGRAGGRYSEGPKANSRSSAATEESWVTLHDQLDAGGT